MDTSQSEDNIFENYFETIEIPSPNGSPVNKKCKQKSYRKKVETEWSHENILKLIEQVELRRCLWDAGCPEYKFRKDSIWQEVAEAIPVSINDCKGKWANLRTSFNCNVEKWRKRKSGQGADENFAITWKYFKPLMFLENAKLRQSTSSTSSMQLECITDESVLAELGYNDDMSSPSPLPGQQRIRKSNTPKNAGRGNELKEMALEALQSMRHKQLQPKDSSTAFAEYIAAELKTLTPEQAQYARSKLRRAFNNIMDEVLMVPIQQQEIAEENLTQSFD